LLKESPPRHSGKHARACARISYTRIEIRSIAHAHAQTLRTLRMQKCVTHPQRSRFRCFPRRGTIDRSIDRSTDRPTDRPIGRPAGQPVGIATETGWSSFKQSEDVSQIRRTCVCPRYTWRSRAQRRISARGPRGIPNKSAARLDTSPAYVFACRLLAPVERWSDVTDTWDSSPAAGSRAPAEREANLNANQELKRHGRARHDARRAARKRISSGDASPPASSIVSRAAVLLPGPAGGREAGGRGRAEGLLSDSRNRIAGGSWTSSASRRSTNDEGSRGRRKRIGLIAEDFQRVLSFQRVGCRIVIVAIVVNAYALTRKIGSGAGFSADRISRDAETAESFSMQNPGNNNGYFH